MLTLQLEIEWFVLSHRTYESEPFKSIVEVVLLLFGTLLCIFGRENWHHQPQHNGSSKLVNKPRRQNFILFLSFKRQSFYRFRKDNFCLTLMALPSNGRHWKKEAMIWQIKIYLKWRKKKFLIKIFLSADSTIKLAKFAFFILKTSIAA